MSQKQPGADTPNRALDSENFKSELLSLVPYLRAFARSLNGGRDAADDLAQETLAKAWEARASYQSGTNLKAWLFTIMRNQFYSERRRAWRKIPLDAEAAANIIGNYNGQEWASELSDVARALNQLSAEQREALILVGAGGFSYEEAAQISNCAIGTVKSRVARARKGLEEILDGSAGDNSVRPAPGEAANVILTELDRLTPLNSPACARRTRSDN